LGHITAIHHIELHVPQQLGEHPGRLDGLREVEEALEIIGGVEDHMVYSTVVQVLLNVIMRGPVTRPIDPTKRAERRELGNPTHPLDLARINEVTLRGYPETFSHCCNEITPPPCGNETRGDRREQVCSA